MGQRQSVFEEKQLELYQDCTYFTRKDILKLYRRFSALNPEKINPRRANVTTRLSISEVMRLTELRENPFSYRICEVFSTDGRGMHFDDVLDMFSVLSERAPWDLKATYAFRIYDFNNDAAICAQDIKEIVGCLTDNSLTLEEEEAIALGVFQESDVVKDHQIHYAEFEHVISRAPDFVNLFHITV